MTTNYASQVPNNFGGAGRSDILFHIKSVTGSGELLAWQIDDYTVTGAVVIGSPGPDYSYVSAGDFYGDGNSDIIWRSQIGLYWIWQMSGHTPIGSATLFQEATDVRPIAVADFNGDGRSEILSQDTSGSLQVRMSVDSYFLSWTYWLGSPGPEWTYLGVGDFNNDGASDLLFENSAGQYRTWLLGPDGFFGDGGAILAGLPGPDWVFKGVGNFDGLGDSDILFQNVTNGVYATWDVHDYAIASCGNLGSPGPDWTLAAIGNYSPDGRSDLLFRNLKTGVYWTWDLTDRMITGGGLVGDPGAICSIASLPAAVPASTLILQDANGALVSWRVINGAVAATGLLGALSPGWSVAAVGDFYGDRQSDLLLKSTADAYWIWRTDGLSVIGGGGVGMLTGWTFKGLADLNGDGRSDLLFQDDSNGVLGAWEMNGTSILNVATFGSPGAGFTYAGMGDFTGSGESDILFRDANGGYWEWLIGGDSVIGYGYVGDPGFGWTLKGIADVSGDGRSDLLFSNDAGVYLLWYMDGATVLNASAIETINPQWSYAGMAALNANGQMSLIMQTANGHVGNWLLADDGRPIGGGAIGDGQLGQPSGLTLIAAR